MNKAWHLRQDGKAFPVKVHMYCMGDDDLSSEAEVSAFLISSDSKDKDLAESVLDAWMALLIEEEVSYDADKEEIDRVLSSTLDSLPYKFQYPLPKSKLLEIHRKLNNYSDIDTLYEYTDKVRENLEEIQENIKQSINQQFCRVRFGGQYNTVSGNNEIWFRISSVGYNWANTIYVFTSSIKNSYKISNITICRDSESDRGFDNQEEYFYKAKDGTYYKHLPIDEYLGEEHEHNPIFESINMNEGVISTMKKLLARGYTHMETNQRLIESDIYVKNRFNYLLKQELQKFYIKERVDRKDIPVRLKGC